MEYRTLPHGGERIGVIGMGSSVIGARPESEIIGTVRAAVELGVNCFDMAGGHAAIFGAYGKALQDLRDRVYLQVHFGADYTSGEYGWTTDLEGVKRSVDWQLRNLKTDYIDFGFIHCIDEASDLVTYEKNGVLDFFETSAEERDYSCISAFTPEDSKGKCVYCKHCQPCPVGLDIGLINKYYDLARLGDGLAKEHYLTLEHRAEDCVGCGHCDSRCPFHVAQSARMQEIQAYFGA